MLKNIIDKNVITSLSKSRNIINAKSIKLIINNKIEQKILNNGSIQNQCRNQCRNYLVSSRNYSTNSNKNPFFGLLPRNENTFQLKISNSINDSSFKSIINKYYKKKYSTETKKKYKDVQGELKQKLEVVPFNLLSNEAKEVI